MLKIEYNFNGNFIERLGINEISKKKSITSLIKVILIFILIK